MKYQLLFVLIFLCGKSFGQFTINLNGNQYVPISETNKGTVPIFYASSATGVVIGGFGLGTTYLHDLNENHFIKGKLSLNNHFFLSEEYLFVDLNGQPLGSVLLKNRDWNINLAALYGKKINKFYLAGGIGTDILVASRTYGIEGIYNGMEINEPIKNNHYRTIVPTAIFEMGFLLNKWTFSMDYNLAITNRLKGATTFVERYFTGGVSVGYFINK